MNRVEEYRRLEKRMLQCIQIGDESGEEECLDQMDDLWVLLTLTERARIEERDL